MVGMDGQGQTRQERTYEAVVREHFARYRQMVFVTGPRQVGKTTLAMAVAGEADRRYLSWDSLEDRELMLAGAQTLAGSLGLDRAREQPLLVVLDELHKYSGWKSWLKGFYDRYKERCNILVTGSARLDVFRKGGDSLMGRYFSYRLHPFSVAELQGGVSLERECVRPQDIDDARYQGLLRWGGFPDPFLRQDQRFYNRWSRLREQQFIREDIREMTRIQELDQLEVLASLLRSQAGQLASYASLAKKVRVSMDSIRRWTATLEALYYCFPVRPWHRNVTRAILKEPKFYLWDWSQCQDEGRRAENLIASALLKATHFWTDIGLGVYGLHYVRDKDKREVDFLVTRNQRPWMLVEVKKSAGAALSASLRHFSKALAVPHAFQAVIDAAYVDADLFAYREPMIVPARTLLSQLC